VVFVLLELTRIETATQLGAADVIIVGAGAVGISMAVDLARAGRRVLLLEAGPKYLSKKSQEFFESASYAGRPLEGLHKGRFRALGGTTNFWGGQLVRMDPVVFQHRPWVADVGWPITESDLLGAYSRTFDLLGMRRQIPEDVEVWQRLRIPPPPNTEEVQVFFTRWTPEANFARLFGRDIVADRNLTVLVEAQVVALRFSDGVVQGVSVKTSDGREFAFRSSVVILANGTIEIARLLQLPLADGSPAPWSANRWLGRGFMDHIDCYAGRVFPKDGRRFHEVFDNAYLAGIKYNPKLKLTSKAQTEAQAMSVACHFVFNSSLSEHIHFAKLFFASLLRGRYDGRIFSHSAELVSLCRVAIPMIQRYLRYRRMYNLADQDIQLRVTAEQKPLASSAIKLKGVKDAFGIPTVEVEWHVDGQELSTIARFGEIVSGYLEKFDLATVKLAPALVARDPSFLTALDDANHHMGGTRMASSATLGVVDRNLRVFGTHNLYVAGAATFPTAGFVNPTLTAIALGLRLTSMLFKQQ
jgi:choline dehydrogenase-like flavoprotein